MSAALRAVFKEHPTKRSQRPQREAVANGLELLTQSQLDPLLSIRHGVGVDSLVEGVRAHLGLRIEIDEEITETFQGHRRLFDQFRGHQLDEILPSHFAAGSLDKLALAGQGLSVLGIEYRGEFPFDFAGRAVHLVFQLPRDVPVRICDGHNAP
jgi:hypothetical protein